MLIIRFVFDEVTYILEEGSCTRIRWFYMLWRVGASFAKRPCGSARGREPERCGRRCRGEYRTPHAVCGAVAPNTRLVTDDWPSYNDIPDIEHKAITVGPMAAHIVLPWIHRLFSNLKRCGLGVYHGLRRTNLQRYLNEFVFRFNRRRKRHAAFDTPPRHRRPHRPGSLPGADPQGRLAKLAHSPQHVEPRA